MDKDEQIRQLTAEVTRLKALAESGKRTVDFVRKRYHVMEGEMFRLIEENERLLETEEER